MKKPLMKVTWGAWVWEAVGKRARDDGACHDVHLHAPILRGAWSPPYEDGALAAVPLCNLVVL